MKQDHSTKANSIGQRLKHEIREYLIISLYLWVCFSTLLFYESAILQAENVKLALLGSAAFKALILGKFILIGKAINVGEQMNPGILLQRIAWKSVAMLLLLAVFKMIEELVVGMTHGHSATQAIAEFIARGWLQNIAPGVVMLLVLIPLIAYEELDKALGKGSLKRMLFERRQQS